MTNQFCDKCGSPLTMDATPYCSVCNFESSQSGEAVQPAPTKTELLPPDEIVQAEPLEYAAAEGDSSDGLPDPDSPPWSVPGAIGVWLFWVAAIFVLPILVVGIMLGLRSASGEGLPLTADEMQKLLLSPPYILGQVAATYPAHLLTLAVCWLVVTGFNKRPFLDALGWEWQGPPLLIKAALVPSVCIGVFAIAVILDKILPNSNDTTFEQIINSSAQVRYALAALAVFSAPFVEEFVYRGVLFGALRKRVGVLASIIVVPLLFSGVHVPQYFRAWAGLASLLVLSFILTLIRAATKSIKPCVAIHLLFNAVQALVLVTRAGK